MAGGRAGRGAGAAAASRRGETRRTGTAVTCCSPSWDSGQGEDGTPRPAARGGPATRAKGQRPVGVAFRRTGKGKGGRSLQHFLLPRLRVSTLLA